jgi:hypothetical protein
MARTALGAVGDATVPLHAHSDNTLAAARQ